MRVAPERLNDFDGKTCFICGNYLLNNSHKDLAYAETHTGSAARARPDKYYLFTCPSCGRTAHKRCWYEIGEKRSRRGMFAKAEWQLVCPSCHQVLSPVRHQRVEWKFGYQIPGHNDSELIELQTADVLSWKAARAVGIIGKAIDGLFMSIGLGSLTIAQRNAIAQAANRIGKTFGFVTSAFTLNATPEERRGLTELKCHNCGAPLPLPGLGESAVVCPHCGTAHLLPT